MLKFDLNDEGGTQPPPAPGAPPIPGSAGAAAAVPGGKVGTRFTCAGCGADMVFDAATGGMKCPYCGRTEAVAVDPDATVEERPYEQYLQADPARMTRLSEQALEVSCSGCGSTVQFEPPEVAGSCPFCGAKIVAQPRASDPLVAPEGVLPFKVTNKQATESIRKWLSSRWFAPNALKKQAEQGGIQSVYVPFWTYDSQTYSDYTGQRGEHYYETEWYTERDAQGNTQRKSRQVRKTRWYPASGSVSRHFDDVLVPATNAVQKQKLDALQPWDLAEVKPYEPAFLSGHKAQRYQVELPAGFEVAKSVMAAVIDGDVRRDIGGDEQQVHHISTAYDRITFKHLMLPVYISAYRFESKVYQTVVNARTGEVQGDRPYSIWKIAALVIFILAVILFFYLMNG